VTQWSGPPDRFGGPNPIGGSNPDDLPNEGAPAAPPPGSSRPGVTQARSAPGGAPAGSQSPPWQAPGNFPHQPMTPFGPHPYQQKPRRRLRVALLVGVPVVVISVLVAIVVTISGGGKKPGSAVGAVKGYLEALARGDAQAALSFAKDEPATKQFLTDQILKKQIAMWPITNIRILGTESLYGGSEYVHIAVNFGDQTSDETMSVKEYGHGEWKLKAGAIKLKFLAGSGSEALRTLTLFGEKLDGNQGTYIFPGPVDFGNTNPNITQKAQSYPLLLNQMTGLGSASSALSMNYDISDAGRAAVQDAVKGAVVQCAKSTQLKPPNCPQLVREPNLVDGTAQWTAPTDFSGLQLSFFDADRLTILVRGDVDFHLTAKSTADSEKSGRVTDYLMATADLSKSPPAITFDPR
jgi:hypothetical protein